MVMKPYQEEAAEYSVMRSFADFTQIVGWSDQRDEMDGACDVHRKEEKSVKGFGERT
jgi:hypothetical protein